MLSGVTHREDVDRYPYQPTYVLDSIGDIDLLDEQLEKAQRKQDRTNERQAAVDSVGQ